MASTGGGGATTNDRGEDPRRIPSPKDVGAIYDRGADTFDARFTANQRTVRRFKVIDEPQRRIAQGCRRVLELGCGTGRLLATVDAERRIGVDVSARLLAHAGRRGLAVARADAHFLPFGDGTFDPVVAGNGVFRYLDLSRAFRECARVLAPGGRLAVHLYAARPVVLLRPFASVRTGSAGDIEDVADVREPARAAGLTEEAGNFWRTIAFYPYVVRLPAPIAGRLWNHLTLIFRR